MDLDVFVSAHRAEWDRLDTLLRRQRRLTGPEVDELVALYQRTATHLSLIQSSAPDPQLTGRLSQLVARARSAVTGARRASWRDVTRFLTHAFPAAVYRSRHWWVPTALLSTALAVLLGWWIGTHPEVQATIATPSDLRELTRPGGEYETYYSSHPAAAFAAQVWTNNAQAAAMCLVLGVFLGLPVLWILFQNMLNLGIGFGLMSSAGRLDTFLGLVLPHGLLELTAVFVAARHRPAPRLDRHRPGPPHPPHRTGRRRPGRGRHGHRPRPGPLRLRRHRRLRHALRPAHLGPHHHRRDRRARVPHLRLRPRRPGRAHRGDGRRGGRRAQRHGADGRLMCGHAR